MTHAVVRLERRACQEADVIIETNATRARRFARFDREAVIVGNFPPSDAFPEPVLLRKPSFAYTGPITRHRGFLQLLDALKLVRREYPNAGLKVIGTYDPRDNLRAEVEERLTAGELSGAVRLLGTVNYEAMFREIGECVAGVILLQPGRPNDYTGQPNKLFEFMGSGLVVIASDFPEIGPILRREECGWLVDPTRPDAIAAAMASVLADANRAADMGQRGRQAVRTRYNWAAAERALLAAYARLAC
ncbi:MAG: glycosyltransferase [bacterium]